MQLKTTACNVYCDTFKDDRENAKAYLASFARNLSNKVSGLKNILHGIDGYAKKMTPERPPLDIEGKAKPWEGIKDNAES